MANDSVSRFRSVDQAELTAAHEQILAHSTDFLRSVLTEALQSIMNAEVEALCGAGYRQRSEERLTSRNGYRERAWDTRVGKIDLQIPKLRTGSYFPSFLTPRTRVEKALYAAIMEAYIQGVSTRSVENLVQALGATGISKSEVSRICQELDARVKEFLGRALIGKYAYVWLDATYVHVREGGRIVSRAIVVAIGLSEAGRKEVLGIAVGHAETEEFWSRFLRSLLDRGLRGVELVVSDQHAGLRRAIERCMNAQWQRCRVHFMRNVLSRVPKQQKAFVKAMVGLAFQQKSAPEAREQWDKAVAQLTPTLAQVVELLHEAREDVLAFMAHPEGLWSILSSTNTLERLNAEIKRRTDVVQIFPNDASVERLVAAVLMEQHDEWQISRAVVSNPAMGQPSAKDDALLARAVGS